MNGEPLVTLERITCMNVLRCAYCHAPGDTTTRECEGCGTLLHSECWSLAEVCPTLGCARPVPRARKKSPAVRRWGLAKGLSGVAIALLLVGGPLFAMSQQPMQVAYTCLHDMGVPATQERATHDPRHRGHPGHPYAESQRTPGTLLPAIVTCRICVLALMDDPDREQKTSRIDIYRAARYRDGYTRTTHFACSYEHREQLIRLRQSER